MEYLTEQEVRSTIKFSGLFGDKTYAQLTPIHELRQKLEWLYNTYPSTIPEHIHTKISFHVRSTEPFMKDLTEKSILVAVGCTFLVYAMIFLKYMIDILMDIFMYIFIEAYTFIKLYGYMFPWMGIFIIGVHLYYVELTSRTPMHVNEIPEKIPYKNQSSTPIHVNEIPKKTYKKQSISSTLKRKVWDTYIGQTIGQHKCLCCNLTDITQLSFHCGHIVPESKGGETTLSNLLPICQNCNSSMGTKNMIDFMNNFR